MTTTSSIAVALSVLLATAERNRSNDKIPVASKKWNKDHSADVITVSMYIHVLLDPFLLGEARAKAKREYGKAVPWHYLHKINLSMFLFMFETDIQM